MGTMIVSTELDDDNRTATLRTDTTLTAALEVRQQYATWDSIVTANKAFGISLEEQLLLKLSQVLLKRPDSLSVIVKSAIPGLFSVEISMDHDSLVSNVFHIGSKGEEVRPMAIREKYFNPKERFLIKQPLELAKSSVVESIKAHLTDAYAIVNDELSIVTLNKFSTQVTIDKRSILTEKYHERIIIDLYWFPVGESETDMSYEIVAEYAAGLLKAGAFRDAKNEYFVQLVSFNQLLKDKIDRGY